MRSASSAAILMIVLGGIGISGIGGHHPIGWVPYLLAGLLIGGGLLLLLRRPFARSFAVGAAVLTAISGTAPLLGHPGWALPIPAGLSIAVGLYLCVRIAMVKSSRSGFLPSKEASTEASAMAGAAAKPEADRQGGQPSNGAGDLTPES